MKKITENELKNKVSRLREYLTVLEAGYVAPGTTPGMGQDPSNPLNQVKPQDSLSPGEQIVPPATTAQNTKPAPAGAWPADVNAIKAFQKANGLTADGLIGRKTYTALTQQGYKAPVGFGIATDKAPAKPAQSTKPPAPTKPTTPAAPTGTTAQGDDEGNTTITKPDGTIQVVGPDGNAIKPGTNPNLPQNKPAATPPAPTSTQVQTDDDGNHMITTPDGKTVVVGPDGKPLPNGGKVPAPAPAPAPAPGVQTSDDGSQMITGADGKTMATNSDGSVYQPGSNPNLPQNKGAANTIKNWWNNTGDFQKAGSNPWVGGQAPAAAPAAAPAPTQESVGFRNDELSRIVSLVHHR